MDLVQEYGPVAGYREISNAASASIKSGEIF